MPQKLKSFFLALILFSIFLHDCKADFYKAMDAYEQKDYQTAFKEFFSQAEIGEVRSQLNLAVMYYYGQGVKKDVNKAYAWARIGTENDVENLDAKNKLVAIEADVVDKKAALIEYKNLSKKYSYDALFKSLYPVLIKATKANQGLELKPISIIKPRYPKNAAVRGLTGWVTTEFNLDPKGKPRDIRVIQETPKNFFHKSTIKAIKRWKFKPFVDTNGHAKWQHNVRYTLNYKMEGKPSYNHKYFKRVYQAAKNGNPSAETRYAFLKQNVPDYIYDDEENSTSWYFKAATQGAPYAQFGLGQNLIYGKGCKQDKTKGIQWLTRAASNGVEAASEMLAQLSVKYPSKQAQQKAIAFLNETQKPSATTIVQFAWIFATSPYQDLRDPDRAIKMIRDLSWNQYNDDITKSEILAAAFAAKGNFNKAISYQEDALDDAKDGDYYTGDIEQHLADYKHHKSWF